GVYANIALVVNAFLILGIMSIFNATLTLPGIAGFILTIGAAVDANVLINERIREEIRRGRRLLDAVETGYHEAFRAIFDANVTHVISAAIMAYFGSGPVRGFAVVLLIGVVTSVFTAVYFTRMLVALWIRRARTYPVRLPRPPGPESASNAMVSKLRQMIPQQYPGARVDAGESVSGKVSEELAQNSAMAIAFAMLGIALYIWFRFEWQFGVGALLTLAHDVAMTLGFFAFTQLQVDLNVVAAFLTIVGYSLN